MTQEELARELIHRVPTSARKKLAEAIIERRDEIVARYAGSFIEDVASARDAKYVRREHLYLDNYVWATEILLRILEEPA